jgi:hypothetical protein
LYADSLLVRLRFWDLPSARQLKELHRVAEAWATVGHYGGFRGRFK